MEHLHNKLRELRKDCEWSQSELANKLGISQSAYSQIENGFVSISVGHLAKISDIFSVSMDWLVKGKGLRMKMETDRSFIPLVREGAKAGYLRGTRSICDYAEDEVLRLPDIPEGDHCAFEVGLESMAPTISLKDRLVCGKVEDVKTLREDSVLLVIDHEDVILGRLKKPVEGSRLSLCFDNISFPEQEREVSTVRELWVAIGRLTHNLSKDESGYVNRLKKLEGEFEDIKKQLEEMQST